MSLVTAFEARLAPQILEPDRGVDVDGQDRGIPQLLFLEAPV